MMIIYVFTLSIMITLWTKPPRKLGFVIRKIFQEDSDKTEMFNCY